MDADFEAFKASVHEHAKTRSGDASLLTAVASAHAAVPKNTATKQPKKMKHTEGATLSQSLQKIPARYQPPSKSSASAGDESKKKKNPLLVMPTEDKLKRLEKLSGKGSRFVRLQRNDGGPYSEKRANVRLVPPKTVDKLLEIATVKLQLPRAGTLAFTTAGEQINDAILAELGPDAIIVVSMREPFLSEEEAIARKERKAQTHNAVNHVMNSSTPRRKGKSSLASMLSPGLSPRLPDSPALREGFRLCYNTPMQRETAAKVVGERAVSSMNLHSGLGTMSVRNVGLTSFEGMGVLPEVVELYAQHNQVQCMEGIGQQPRLKELHLENNNISSFKGFLPQPRMDRLFIADNPIAEHPNAHLMIAILQPHSALLVDGEGIQKDIRDKAIALAPLVTKALRQGFLLESGPCPSADIDLSLEDYAAFREQEMNGLVDVQSTPLKAQASMNSFGGVVSSQSSFASTSQRAPIRGHQMQTRAAADSNHNASDVSHNSSQADAELRRANDELQRSVEEKENQIYELTERLASAELESQEVSSVTASDRERQLEMQLREKDLALQELKSSLDAHEEEVIKRKQQCRSLYDIVEAMEARMKDLEEKSQVGAGYLAFVTQLTKQLEEATLSNAPAEQTLLATLEDLRGHRADLMQSIGQ